MSYRYRVVAGGRRVKVPDAPDEYPGPTASIAAILEWVGSDPARASLAYDAESGREAGPRSTLLTKLEGVGT